MEGRLAEVVIEEICEQFTELQEAMVNASLINGYYLGVIDGCSYVEAISAEERSFSTAVRTPIIEAVLQELE